MTEIFFSGTEVVSDAKMTESPYERRMIDVYATDLVSPLGDHTTRQFDKGDQPFGGDMTWTNTGGTRSGRRKTF